MTHTHYKFVIHHLISSESVESEEICFSSPHYPSTKKNEDTIEGELFVKNSNCKDIPKETIKACLEASFSLSSQVYFPIDLTKIRTSSLSPLGARVSIDVTGILKKPNEVKRIWDKYLPLFLQDNHVFHHAINWFMRSLKSDDPIDKFIYAWITFNCLYGNLTQAADHRKGIRCLMKTTNTPVMQVRQEIVERHKPIFEFLASQELIQERTKTSYSDELHKSLTENDIDGIIENGVAAIAMVRHTIFHGNIADRNIEAERCIWPLNHLNSEILKKSLFKI